ncbi:hypothetical protein [uncultured Bacteroides sp.]|uniref:hypothetical protein n=1 Tax=uncultured Bacteroides sp. TaxID=162156 RepID=UPI0025DAB7AE|nr:hypothetical protein [uncultured Bacteroides sp.]
MKRTIIKIMFLALIAISGYIGIHNYQLTDENLLNLCLDECEALAGCEIYDSNHKPIATCEGSEGVCYKVTDFLYCAGKKVN